ncbi:MAG: tripartite tricarboxylate transporter substrate-binding protein, partial [Limnohabitans sp.]
TPIGQVGNAPSIMLVPNSSPARTVQEWIEHARKNPGRLNYASSGNGTIVQLTAELFKSQAQLIVVHIPYKGTALAIPDLVSGKVDVLFDSLPTGLPHVREGRLRALGVTSARRTPLAPDLPAIAEVLPGYESTTWFGLFGPRQLPAEVVQRVNAAANQVLKDPEVMDRLTRLGIEPTGGTPAQFAAMLAGESAKWKKIIAERKITLD